MKQIFIAAMLVSISSLAYPQSDRGHDTHHGATSAVTAQELSNGELRRIDREQGKITLRHGQIKNLDMPPMTMVFRVKDPSWFDQFKVGDKVGFRAENLDGVFTVTILEPAR